VSGAGPAVILPLSCRLHDFQNGGSLRVVTSREMDPIRFDPRNHVPEVAPDDLWDDAHGFDSAPGAPVAMLPRKKTQVLPAPVTVADDGGLGLRIQAKRRTRLSEEEEACQLEVRKIDGNVTRLDPETPTVLRVPRQIVFQEAPVGNRLTPPRRDVSKDWGKTGKPSVRWVLGTGLGVATVVIASLMILPLINESNAARSHPNEDGLVVEQVDKIEGMEPVHDLLGRQAEAVRVFKAVVSASSVEEILPWVRDAATVEPLIRARFRPIDVPKDWLPSSAATWNVLAGDGQPFGLLEGNLPDFSKFAAYWVIAGNQLRLDWKATNGYGTATFDELASQRGNPEEIRGKILPSRYFNAAYPETEFQCYQLAAPDDSQAIWCYVLLGDPLKAVLEEICQGGEILNSTPIQQKITIRLKRGPTDSQPNQWLITGVLHKEWLSP